LNRLESGPSGVAPLVERRHDPPSKKGAASPRRPFGKDCADLLRALGATSFGRRDPTKVAGGWPAYQHLAAAQPGVFSVVAANPSNAT